MVVVGTATQWPKDQPLPVVQPECASKHCSGAATMARHLRPRFLRQRGGGVGRRRSPEMVTVRKPPVLMTLRPRETTKKMVVMGPEMQLKKKKMARMRQSVKRTRSARTGNLVAVPMDAHIPKDPRNKAALSVLRKCLCATNVKKLCTVVVLIFKTLQ